MKRLLLVLTLCIFALPMSAMACGGGEGCTPGYWKNHLEAWACTGYSPDDDFATVFGVAPSFTATLLEALQMGGGGEKALARHAAAALLNAGCGHDVIHFGYSVASVITMVQEAYNTGEFEAIKNSFVYENETVCPLN